VALFGISANDDDIPGLLPGLLLPRHPLACVSRIFGARHWRDSENDRNVDKTAVFFDKWRKYLYFMPGTRIE
jgi:hypothetical protein